jgi:hypothetical protein
MQKNFIAIICSNKISLTIRANILWYETDRSCSGHGPSLSVDSILQANERNLTNQKYTENIENSLGFYTDMNFDRDSHFFDLEVNTSHSSVHVPTNVFDQGPEAAEFIQWSAVLDDTFTQNYQSDPALSWQ